MKPVIQFKQVTKQFGSQRVLDQFDLAIEAGEFVAIVGPSGSGKTTILNIMGLLDDYDDGQVLMQGTRLPKLAGRPAEKLRRDTINYLFQSFALIEDNLLLALQFVKNKDKLAMIKQVLTEVELSDKLNAVVNTLSGGEKQRVALARAMVKPGDIILADEPTGALDPKLSEQAFALIKAMQKKSGKTIVMVTHNMAQAEQADRIIRLA